MTLANSIIGVSVLAMPYCFKQCGIVLATLVLILSSILSRLACHFLIKSAVMSRRRNFELLAFHAFGHMGKFLVELFIIGFLVGTCIAFFVVMGDLGPQIVGKVIDKNPEDIRTSLLIATSVFIVLPLGLLRNIDSLSSLCTATIIFYLCLVLKIVTESMQHIFAGDWYEYVYYWRPSGILQCIPIFSMALFCQTQLFEIYETIPNVSLEKMNEVVQGALNICTIVYLCVGFFGYIAFCTQPFTGNILMSFEASLSSEMIKMGFVFSIAFSFPLVIFPCRASLNSLLFRRVYAHEPSVNYLPETRFRCLTIIIVTVSLVTGILIPSIEFVLGLVGSTIGVMICLIFPAIFFISISSKHTNERLLAQVILFIGICIMILSTYANLYALEESTNTKTLISTNKPIQINSLPLNLNKDDINAMANVPNNPEILPNVKGTEKNFFLQNI
ncbi:Putative sodium-coupled neutral amino acid transporter 10 [Habropoda laboriosa]|uniref:Putative sodium-coupled neutral amino acid transporter 10 n=1 Tax=Habropoda laboriosa TaxID=597456 RepID=A0A0L7RAV4_9HYME|nr:Putative sodium-coupled neutral amino acid transporter 10 [Habropoda laboriosa]